MRVGLRDLAVSLVVLVSGAVGALPLMAPSEDAGISMERAVDHVEILSEEPHPMGSEGIVRAREYLVDSLIDVGLAPETQTVVVPDYFGNPEDSVEVTNVLARIPGTEGDVSVLLIAHYDTVPWTVGANDNSAAVAALLESARLLVGDPPARDVLILFTDGEEPTPRYGMSAFVAHHPWFRDVGIAVNFEGIGSGGPPMLVEISGPVHPLIDGLTRSIEHPVAFSFLTKIAELIGGASTDFDVIRAVGTPGYSFAYMRGSSIYHTDQDVSALLNVDGLANQASLALGLARNVGPLGDSAEGETVFFTIPTGAVIKYGSGVAGTSGVAAAGVLGLMLWIRIRRGESSTRRLVRGLGLVVVGSTLAAMTLTLGWIGLIALRGGMGVTETYVWMLVLAVGMIGGWYLIWLGSRTSGADVVGGAALVWALLALTTGLWIPSMSYLFAWPAIATGVGGLVVLFNRTRLSRLLHLAVVALATGIVLIPALDILGQLATPRPGNPDSELSAVIAVPLFLFMLSVGLVHWAVASPPEPDLDPDRIGSLGVHTR